MALDGSDPELQRMNDVLARQKAVHIDEGAPSAELRIDRLNRCIGLLIDYRDRINDALSADFGHRSKDQSDLTDVAGSIGALKLARKNVKKWMRSERRSVEPPLLGLFGARARVDMQPKGSVGVIAPWNFPVNLTFVPLAGILSAGNRCMIKPSEYTPATSDLMDEMFRSAFDEMEIAVIKGGPEVGAAFTSLPFDHILFTGATSIAHHVMRAAADNLVPLTLELGGKSPVIVGNSADLKKTAARVMAGKTLNAGQICLAPDYVLAPESSVGEFVSQASSAVETMFPTLKDNDDYTSVINQRHYDRLQGYLEDAKSKGAEIVEINPADENFSQQPHHKIPPTLVLNPSDDMAVMQEEIFGPILPIKSYSTTDEAIAYVNKNERPLGLYYFGKDKAEESKVLNSTTAGGVTVNDVLFHNAQEDLPFGGSGPSGMGSYHGHDGFLEFTHRKAVYTQAGPDVMAMIRPPYGKAFRGQVGSNIKR